MTASLDCSFLACLKAELCFFKKSMLHNTKLCYNNPTWSFTEKSARLSDFLEKAFLHWTVDVFCFVESALLRDSLEKYLG
jgi:hypothetical protein